MSGISEYHKELYTEHGIEVRFYNIFEYCNVLADNTDKLSASGVLDLCGTYLYDYQEECLNNSRDNYVLGSGDYPDSVYDGLTDWNSLI